MSDIKVSAEHVMAVPSGKELIGIAKGNIRKCDILVEAEWLSDIWEACDFQKYGLHSTNRFGLALFEAKDGEEIAVLWSPYS